MKAVLNPTPIFAFNPGPITGDGNWTWYIPGRIPTLIDAGTGEPRHLDAIGEALARVKLAQVLVTHAHVDHASGAPALRERFGVTRFAKMPWPERDAKWPVEWTSLGDGERKKRQAAGMEAWMNWGKQNSAAIVDQGSPLGKTKRAAAQGVTDIKNGMTGYVIVRAESHAAAAKLFENHPHFMIFPGDSVEIMECLPLPGQ